MIIPNCSFHVKMFLKQKDSLVDVKSWTILLNLAMFSFFHNSQHFVCLNVGIIELSFVSSSLLFSLCFSICQHILQKIRKSWENLNRNSMFHHLLIKCSLLIKTSEIIEMEKKVLNKDLWTFLTPVRWHHSSACV